MNYKDFLLGRFKPYLFITHSFFHIFDEIRHPERLSDPKAFSFKVEGTFNSCLDRQVREGVLITYGEADEILNSKTEYHQPGVTRVVPTREVGR